MCYGLIVSNDVLIDLCFPTTNDVLTPPPMPLIRVAGRHPHVSIDVMGAEVIYTHVQMVTRGAATWLGLSMKSKQYGRGEPRAEL